MRIRSSGMQRRLGDLAHQLDVEALQLALLVDELLRRQGRIDRHLQLARRHQVGVGDRRLAGLGGGRQGAEAGDHQCRGEPASAHETILPVGTARHKLASSIDRNAITVPCERDGCRAVDWRRRSARGLEVTDLAEHVGTQIERHRSRRRARRGDGRDHPRGLRGANAAAVPRPDRALAGRLSRLRRALRRSGRPAFAAALLPARAPRDLRGRQRPRAGQPRSARPRSG